MRPDVQMEMGEEDGEHEECRDGGSGGERGTVVRVYEEYWWHEDHSKWMPELGQAHAAFELGRQWGLEWAACMEKFFDFKSA
jgi:hypothetical protein